MLKDLRNGLSAHIIQTVQLQDRIAGNTHQRDVLPEIVGARRFELRELIRGLQELHQKLETVSEPLRKASRRGGDTLEV